jgi:hypothetical protein
MLFDKRELRQHCISKGKEHYIRYIERYLSLTAQEKLDLWEIATIDKALNSTIFEDVETWWERTVRKIKNNFPHNIAKQKWFDAFLFFNEHEEKEMSKIYQRMGLPKNGIRPDDC